MHEEGSNPNFRPLTEESLRRLELKHNAPQPERVFSRLTLMSDVDEDEEGAAQGKAYDTALLDGKPLPDSLGTFPKCLYGKPIEELDAVRQDERTFCVISRRLAKTSLFRFSATRSMFLLSPIHPIRKAMLFLLTNQLFDLVVISTILINCGFLAMDSPRFDGSDELLVFTISEIVFTAIYTIEMLVKVTGRGFVLEKRTYLRDPWNWLDFIVIILAYVTFFLGLSQVPVGNLSGLRTFRVLRALKTISVIPGLKNIINALLRSLKMLCEVILLTFFFLIIFALLALQLYIGVLHNKCVINYNINGTSDTEEDWFNFVQNASHWDYLNGEPRVCSNISGPGRGWSPCPNDNYTCLPDIGPNPNDGYTSFDNIGMSLLTCFQVITLDYWENVYNLVIRATGPWSMLFFFVIVMLGSFYLVNLMLAVVSMAYTEEMENRGREKEMKIQRTQENVLSMDAEKLKKLAERKRRRTERRRQLRQMQLQQIQDDNVNDDEKRGKFTDIAKADKGSVKDSKTTQADGDPKEDSSDTNIRVHKMESNGDIDAKVPSPKTTGDKPVKCCPNWRWLRYCIIPSSIHRTYKRLQHYAAVFVLDPVMDLFITCCILVNTIFLAMDHQDITESWEYALDVGNKVFTAIFTIECILKLISLHGKFFKSRWNIFDLIIVICSLVELGLEGIQGLLILRAFRLLRVLKLAQSWTTMRMLITIVGSTIGALGNVSFVLLIIVYIFAVMGMQLLGQNYTAEAFGGNLPRWHFRDFLHSLLLIFRILCGEWVEPLYDCMSCSDTATCIILFISAYMVGNIMILNLFLALLLNSFATDSLKKTEDGGEKRLALGVAKLRNWSKALLGMCWQRCRRSAKVGPQEQAIDTAVISCENKDNRLARTEHDTVVATFMVVEENKTIPQRRLDRERLCGKPNAFEMHPIPAQRNTTVVDVLPFKKDSITSSVAEHIVIHTPSHTSPSFKSSNMFASSSLYKDDGYRDSSAASLRHRPISRNVPLPSLSNPRNKTNAPPGITVVLNTDSETGEKETCEVVQEPVVQAACRPDSAASRSNSIVQETIVEAGIPEDSLHECCPQLCTSFCERKFPCDFNRRPGDSSWFAAWKRTRQLVCTVVENKIFEWFILLAILVSTITLMFEDIYLPSNPVLQKVLAVSNVVFAVIFVSEMLLKWIGIGFVKYFTSFWCWLDFVIVIIAIMSLVFDALGLSSIGAFKALRTLRALRPLRAISRWQGIKIVVNALAHAVPSIINVLLVCLVFWLIFSIMGVQFFKGTFAKCVDEAGQKLPVETVNNYTDCLRHNYTWVRSKINFDNFINGYMALFQVATFEGWQEVMEDAVDSRGVGMQPDLEASFAYYLFFVIFIFFGSFFTLNLFIGVIIDNFNQLKRKYEGDSSFGLFLTSNQRNYYHTMIRLGKKKPKKQIKQPTNIIQAFLVKLTTNNKFEIAIVFVILLNMLTMSVDHYNQSEEVTAVLRILNIVFTTIFTLEMILKLMGMGIHYFRVAWNVFDFIVVMFSILGIILEDILQSFINPTLLRVFRLVRIGRILRLVKAAKGLRKLIFALAVSMPALINIGALLFLFIFIFAIIGMSQFGYVKQEGALDDVVNFETWLHSMSLLFRLSTSAGWNDVLDPIMTAPPDCNNTYNGYPNGNCGSYILGGLYLFLFLTLNYLVIINMYIAVILENFGLAHAQEEVGITEDDFAMFYHVWQRFDPNATQFILYEELSDFCDSLEQPLRLEKPNNIKIAGLELPIYDDVKLHCLDVLCALTKRVIGNVEESDEFRELQETMVERFKDLFPVRTELEPTTTTMQVKTRWTAAKKIQQAFRRHKLLAEIRNAAAAKIQNSHIVNGGCRQNSDNREVYLASSNNAQDEANRSITVGSCSSNKTDVHANAHQVDGVQQADNCTINAMQETTLNSDSHAVYLAPNDNGQTLDHNITDVQAHNEPNQSINVESYSNDKTDIHTNTV